ncbi:MAG: hypothetical protein ACK4ZJ_00285 [Allorhizobium sp.]
MPVPVPVPLRCAASQKIGGGWPMLEDRGCRVVLLLIVAPVCYTVKTGGMTVIHSQFQPPHEQGSSMCYRKYHRLKN